MVYSIFSVIVLIIEWLGYSTALY